MSGWRTRSTNLVLQLLVVVTMCLISSTPPLLILRCRGVDSDGNAHILLLLLSLLHQPLLLLLFSWLLLLPLAQPLDPLLLLVLVRRLLTRPPNLRL